MLIYDRMNYLIQFLRTVLRVLLPFTIKERRENYQSQDYTE